MPAPPQSTDCENTPGTAPNGEPERRGTLGSGREIETKLPSGGDREREREGTKIVPFSRPGDILLRRELENWEKEVEFDLNFDWVVLGAGDLAHP